MTIEGKPGRYYHSLGDGRLQCDLCPRDCRVGPGQRGLCFVRQNEGGEMWLTTYGRSSGFCVDPIEKKPLNHFYPGSSVLSLGTAGCNLTCRFCQNWDISKSRDFDTLAGRASPEAIARAAREQGCRSVACTYNDPTIFVEYAMDIADACREVGVESVAVTAGYIHDAPRRDYYRKLDALNVDLKAFTEDFYRKLCTASLAVVQESLEYVVHETDAWLEITTLIIPGHNDDDAEIARMCEWIADRLGTEIPVHFSAFHPDFKMLDVPRTSPATLRRAREVALGVGLRHVYTGNVHDLAGDTTRCAGCGAQLIQRDWYQLLEYRLTADGTCPECGIGLAGRFEPCPTPSFGRRRLRVAIDESVGSAGG